MLKRVAVVVLSAWVLLSGSAWQHTNAGRLNNTIVGAGLLYFGALSIRHDWARYVTLALGLWLFAFTAVLGRGSGGSPVAFWNDAMVAVAIFVLSLLGGDRRRVLGPPYFPPESEGQRG
jgi:hypothetical protein